MTRYTVGRSLQLLGMMILPFGIASELEGAIGLGQSLMVAGLGVVVFLVGRSVQGDAKG